MMVKHKQKLKQPRGYKHASIRGSERRTVQLNAYSELELFVENFSI